MKWIALPGEERALAQPGSDSAKNLLYIPGMIESSSDMKPLRWLAHLPLVILPCLAAAMLEGPRLPREIEQRVTLALAAEGQNWAKVQAQGRDVEIRGVAPSGAALDAARAAARATWGVRIVDMRVGLQQ